jgi:integrase
VSIYKRKSGRYAVLVDLDPTDLGGRRRKSVGTYRTRKEAEAAERKALEARDRGIDLSPKTVTVSELLDRYLADREALERGAKTLQEYRGCADRLIRPHFGGVAIAKLRPARIAEWVAILLKRGGKPTKDSDDKPVDRPLSAKSVYHAFTLLNGAMRFALRMELVGRNPCEAATRPRVRRSNAKALTADEVTRLLAAASGSRWETFFALALATGARRGELCALSWDDYDATEKGTLTFCHSLSQTRRGIALKETKTGRIRQIPMSHLATDALRSQRALQAGDRLASGCSYDNDAKAVFTDELGRQVTPMAATCAFERIARKAEISTTRLQDLRHTTASYLIAHGVDIRTVAAILGHASPSVTLTVYAHLIPEKQNEAVDWLGDHLQSLTTAVGFDAARQPNGNRLAASIKKSLQIQAISGSANGNRTPPMRSRPIPSIDKNAYLIGLSALHRSSRFPPIPRRSGRSVTNP